MKTAFNTGKLPWNTISNSSVKSYTIMQYASIIKENILHTTSHAPIFQEMPIVKVTFDDKKQKI